MFSHDQRHLEEREAGLDHRLVLQLDLFFCEEPGTVGAGLLITVAIFDEPLVVDEVDSALQSAQRGIVEANLALFSPADHQRRQS